MSTPNLKTTNAFLHRISTILIIPVQVTAIAEVCSWCIGARQVVSRVRSPLSVLSQSLLLPHAHRAARSTAVY